MRLFDGGRENVEGPQSSAHHYKTARSIARGREYRA